MKHQRDTDPHSKPPTHSHMRLIQYLDSTDLHRFALPHFRSRRRGFVWSAEIRSFDAITYLILVSWPSRCNVLFVQAGRRDSYPSQSTINKSSILLSTLPKGSASCLWTEAVGTDTSHPCHRFGMVVLNRIRRSPTAVHPASTRMRQEANSMSHFTRRLVLTEATARVNRFVWSIQQIGSTRRLIMR